MCAFKIACGVFKKQFAMDRGGMENSYRKFVYEGFEILVGKNDIGNDYLTFNIALPTDLWFHTASGIAGSHTIISNPEQLEVPQSVIERAAQLSAWFSKARNSKKVEIHMCSVCDISKPKNSADGLVEIKNWKVLFVEPRRME